SGHDGILHHFARVDQVDVVPGVRILATDAVQVRAGALGAPQEGTVVNKFVRSRVGPVALDFGDQGTDLLRVTNTATFANVDIPSGEFDRIIEMGIFAGLTQ